MRLCHMSIQKCNLCPGTCVTYVVVLFCYPCLGRAPFLHHFTLPAVKRCVILPHSIHGVDDFVKALDERHVVFCRERRTLSYCRSLNNQAEFILAHDMGVGLVVDDLPESGDMEVPESDLDAESMAQYQLLSGGAAAHARHLMHRATVELAQSGRKVAFVLRTDREKKCKDRIGVGV